MPKITIDGVEFNSEDLSENGKLQLDSLSYVDKEIKKLQTELSIIKNSKVIYSRELQRSIDAASS